MRMELGARAQSYSKAGRVALADQRLTPQSDLENRSDDGHDRFRSAIE
jgi:hypothetical protein